MIVVGYVETVFVIHIERVGILIEIVLLGTECSIEFVIRGRNRIGIVIDVILVVVVIVDVIRRGAEDVLILIRHLVEGIEIVLRTWCRHRVLQLLAACGRRLLHQIVIVFVQTLIAESGWNECGCKRGRCGGRRGAEIIEVFVLWRLELLLQR